MPRPHLSGDKVTASEYLLTDMIDNQTSGEALSGATTPVPVFIQQSDGKVYNSDANDTTKLLFDGFAIETVAGADLTVAIQFEGIVTGFTGLTKGDKYYVQDDGIIGTTKGATELLVGVAISTTEIKIMKEEYEVWQTTPSDILRQSADTERSECGTSYVKVKEITIRVSGIMRMKFDLKKNGIGTGFGQIFKDGVAFGSEQSEAAGGAYVTKSQDLKVVTGELIQLFLKDSSADGGSCTFAENFRLYFDWKRGDFTTVDTD